MQPLLVSISALTLATETVRSILKIDDVVSPAGQPAAALTLQTVFSNPLITALSEGSS